MGTEDPNKQNFVGSGYGPTKVCDVAHMAIFGNFFVSCVFSEPRAAGFRPAS